jgi:hypothetical protein
MLKRFEGDGGRRLRIEALAAQKLIAGVKQSSVGSPHYTVQF